MRKEGEEKIRKKDILFSPSCKSEDNCASLSMDVPGKSDFHH